MSRRARFGSLCPAVLVGLAGCGSSPSQPALASPMVTIAFVPAALAVDGLTLTTATLHLDHIRAVGDAPPSTPPPGAAPLIVDSLDLDALGTGVNLTQEIPQGLYSRVELMFRDVMLGGTWKGAAFTAHLAMFQGPRVELRATTQQEAAVGGTISYTVSVAPSQWFFDSTMQPVLDSATVDATADAGSTITCDDTQNSSVAMTMTSQIAASFALK